MKDIGFVSDTIFRCIALGLNCDYMTFYRTESKRGRHSSYPTVLYSQHTSAFAIYREDQSDRGDTRFSVRKVPVESEQKGHRRRITLVIKHFLYDFFYVGDQLEFAIIDNGNMIVIVSGIMASPRGTRRARYTLGKPKVCARDLRLQRWNVFLFPYSIVIGDYYSGDARYLVVNDYSVLQLLLVTNW